MSETDRATGRAEAARLVDAAIQACLKQDGGGDDTWLCRDCAIALLLTALTEAEAREPRLCSRQVAAYLRAHAGTFLVNSLMHQDIVRVADHIAESASSVVPQEGQNVQSKQR